MMGYKEYTEIPFHLREYFESVAESNSLEEIPLEEINGFMQMMEEVERGKYWTEKTEDL
jgi:hypothetical protein